MNVNYAGTIDITEGCKVISCGLSMAGKSLRGVGSVEEGVCMTALAVWFSWMALMNATRGCLSAVCRQHMCVRTCMQVVPLKPARSTGESLATIWPWNNTLHDG